MQNKVCVYAICKNESKYVSTWLDSMSEADYIVVLDTGSTDDTHKLLKSDPRVTKIRKKVIDPWRFDVARNESMKLVPKDANILVCTDLDEVFELGWADKLRSNWVESTTRCHYTYVWSHTDIGNPGLTFIYDKIHTREYKWYYPVHEVLGLKSNFNDTFKFEAESPTRVLNLSGRVTLHHYPDESKSRSSYFDLLQLRLEENPDDCYSMYLLGREYGIREEYDNAIKYFEGTINLPTIDSYPLVRHACLGYLGDIYLSRGNIAEAVTCYTLQIQLDPTYREPYYGLSELYCRMGMHKVALAYVEEALQKTYQHLDWSEKSPVWNEKTDDLLGICYYYLGDHQLAVKHSLKALKLSPNNERLQNNYLKFISEIEE